MAENEALEYETTRGGELTGGGGDRSVVVVARMCEELPVEARRSSMESRDRGVPFATRVERGDDPRGGDDTGTSSSRVESAGRSG
jgi:hypothetical protein